jgi:hypothetical protein
MGISMDEGQARESLDLLIQALEGLPPDVRANPLALGGFSQGR